MGEAAEFDIAGLTAAAPTPFIAAVVFAGLFAAVPAARVAGFAVARRSSAFGPDP